jgi:hypothetical protein
VLLPDSLHVLIIHQNMGSCTIWDADAGCHQTLQPSLRGALKCACIGSNNIQRQAFQASIPALDALTLSVAGSVASSPPALAC